MDIEIKFYKLYDLDLVGLRELGYPVGDMAKQALIAYANGHPIHYFIDEHGLIPLNDKKSFRCRWSIKDEKTIALLKNIKKRQRNSFLKMVLRDSIVGLNLSSYYTQKEYTDLEKQKLTGLQSAFPNTYVLDKNKIRQRRIDFQNALLVQTITGVKQDTHFELPPNEADFNSENNSNLKEIEELKQMVKALASRLDEENEILVKENKSSSVDKNTSEHYEASEKNQKVEKEQKMPVMEQSEIKQAHEELKTEEPSTIGIQTDSELDAMFDGLMDD